ncbi:MAG: GTPase HflX, partial [Casimicrobiaceae bacterium]
SFKSTLEETLEASLLLHVIDASDAGWERQLEVTDTVLDEIGATDVPRIRVFNKIDHVGDNAAQAECGARLRVRYPGCIVMSARRAEDVAKLHAAIVGFFRAQLIEVELFLPWSAQQLRGEIFARCEMVEERADGDGAFFRVRGDQATLNSLKERIAQVA